MVFGILDRATQEPPGLTAPRVTLSVGDGGQSAFSGLTGAVGAGGSSAALADGLVQLRLHRAVAPDVDWAELLLTPVPGGPDMPAPGDSSSIEVAVGERTSKFSGFVDLVEHRSDSTVRLTVTNGGRVLARTRTEIAFVEQSPGTIIDSLCADAGVESNAGSVGETLPQYIVDAGRSMLDHIALLAETTGQMVVFNDDGELELFDDTAAGEVVATLVHGGTLLDARLGKRLETGAAIIDGAGVSEQGGNAWSWLRKEVGPHRAEAGTAPPDIRHAAPWIRSPDGASTLTAARVRNYMRQATPGRILAAATPEAVPGALVDLQGTAQDGTWRILVLDLNFDRKRGLLSEIKAAPLSGSGGIGGLPGGSL